MAKTRLTSDRRLLIGIATLLTLTVFWHLSIIIYTPVEAKLGIRHLGDVDRSSVSLLPVSNLTLAKRSDDDGLDYYGERGGLDSSSSEESEHEDNRGTDAVAELDRADQEDDGEEGKAEDARKANYKACVERGRNLIRLFGEKTIPGTEQSKFNAWEDLKNHGWTFEEASLDPTIRDQCLVEPLKELSVPFGSNPGAKSTWRSLSLTHTKGTKGSDGKTYPPTLGKSENIFNPEQGTIVGIRLDAPAFGDKGKQLSPGQITPMRFASDILYLAWEHQCKLSKVSPAALKHYLGANVENEATRNAVREALGGGFLVKKLPEWPGVDFTTNKNEEEMAALVGTPIGTAVGRMLAQRKSTMGHNRRISNIRVWSEQPYSDKWFKDHGPLLYMLFKLSDPPSGAQGAQQPAMLKCTWSKPSVGQSEDVSTEPSFSKGSAKSGGAKSKMEDTLQKSAAQAGAAGSSKQSTRPQAGSSSTRRSRHRCATAQSPTRILHPENRGEDNNLTLSDPKSKQCERGLPKDDHAPIQHRELVSETVSIRTREDTTASHAKAVLRKLVRRTERVPPDLNAHLKPKDGKLPFQGSSGSSSVEWPNEDSVSQVTGYGDYGNVPPRAFSDSFIINKAEKIGYYWRNRLGTDTISTGDESVVPPIYDQGDYWYEMDQNWQLPREPLGFDGLPGLVPGFYDAQGKAEETWKPLKWFHKQEWVDDEDFKHHPLSAGMFENAYSTEHRAILYWSHVEPSNYPPKSGKPNQQQGQAPPANRPQPAGSGFGTSASSQHWSDYPIQQFPDEEGPPKEVNLAKHDGKQIPEEDLTPINLPDNWMFDWMRVCEAARHPVSDLKHVIIPHVLETHTFAVVKELQEGDIRLWGPWPGATLRESGLEHNEPILGTPLGVSFAKLLVQRHEMFGSERTLVGGQVWWNAPPKGSPEGHEGTVGLMLTLDDPPAELLQRQRAALPPLTGQHQAVAGASQLGAPGKRPGTSPPQGQMDPKRPKPGVQ